MVNPRNRLDRGTMMTKPVNLESLRLLAKKFHTIIELEAAALTPPEQT